MEEAKKPSKLRSKTSLKKFSDSNFSGRKSNLWNGDDADFCGHLLSFKSFRLELDRYKEDSSALYRLERFYENLFGSFDSLNKCFKRKQNKREKHSDVKRTSETCLKQTESQPVLSDSNTDRKFVASVYQGLVQLPDQVKKSVLLGITNCLLKQRDNEPTQDILRGYFILIQNPVFADCDSYVVFAHLIKQLASLTSANKLLLCQWLRRLSTPKFRPLVRNIHTFISRSMQLMKQQNSATDWRLPSSLSVLQLLNDANNYVKPRLISFREFYNESINHIDLLKEFDKWKTSLNDQFNFCKYPCTLTLVSKQRIIRHEQELEMISNARQEIETQLRRRRAPPTDQLFLNIQIRRQHLLQDSLDQIFLNKDRLKKKLRVEFVGEPGFDMGGITKEWFLLLLRQILRPDYNTFVYNEKTRCYWFAHNSSDNSSDLFLVGVLLGLAVYNGITLQFRMPIVCYRKLLNVCTNQRQSSSHVPVTLDDFRLVDPDMAHGLEELLRYEGDVEEDFDLRFEVDDQDIGCVTTSSLLPNGRNIPVTNSNRHQYVQLIVDHKLNRSIHRQFSAFSRGFLSVFSSEALSFLCPEELEVLICGVVGFSITDLRKYTTYKGYTDADETVNHLWQVLSQLSHSKQKQFLHFCTGGDRIPVCGWQQLKFTIIKAPTSDNMLPMAHTCFNQLLLPAYNNKQTLADKLTIAIDNSEGFGLE